MTTIRAWAAPRAGAALEPFAYDPGPLGADEVEVAVESCGLCHSDLSMLDNAWRRSAYPLVPGHEVVGRIVACGSAVPQAARAVGQRVGIGWNASSCMHCAQCVAGDAHLCADGGETIVGRHGGFAERVRCQWEWATPLPEGIDAAIAGPLFCAGITVFSPLVEFGVRPTDRVAVAGIGGLGHLALQFLRAWGCEVTALSSSAAKRAEARALGAHHAVDSRSREALRALTGAFDFVLVTVNVPLDWHALLKTLAPRGRLHFVGTVLEPPALAVPQLIGGQKEVSGSPMGRPATVATMLQFCARHGIAPRVERFPMAQVNAALAHLREGRAHYRVVLDADFA